MRVAYWIMLVFSLVTSAAAQQPETNFASGPQYLITTGSAMYARSITTPSLSLSAPPLQVGAANSTGILIAGATADYQLPPSAVAVPKIDLFPIFYGDAPVGSPANEIELSFPPGSNFVSATPSLPPSFSETGGGEFTTIEALREQGYGVTLAEVAASVKAHRMRLDRVYTNADVARLHGGS
jgi:hypothetical protein